MFTYLRLKQIQEDVSVCLRTTQIIATHVAFRHGRGAFAAR